MIRNDKYHKKNIRGEGAEAESHIGKVLELLRAIECCKMNAE